MDALRGGEPGRAADGVYLFRTGDRSPLFVNVPIVARDLVWR